MEQVEEITEITTPVETMNTKFFENEVKLYGTYDYNVKVDDITQTELVAINTSKTNVFIPHTSGRYQTKRFKKATCPIVERLTNTLMRHGRNTGKKNLALQIIKQTLDIIALITGKNPLETLLKAVSNGGPREDSARTGSGGTAKKSSVDVSPMRRINLALYLMTTGARKAAFRNIRNISECLADEIIATATMAQSSFTIRKKEEIERGAKANR
jgi:small subunit ribosomal protein S5e